MDLRAVSYRDNFNQMLITFFCADAKKPYIVRLVKDIYNRSLAIMNKVACSSLESRPDEIANLESFLHSHSCLVALDG